MCQGRHLVPDAHVRPPVVIEMYVSSYHIPCVLQAVEGFPGIDTLSFYYTVCPFCNGVVGRIGVFGHADADMVLADDNFATIVAAVAQGRRIYDNIRKAIQFLLGSNLSEVLSIFTATILGFTILKPVHLLFINLVTDSIPALALGLERPERDIMNRKPRNSKEGVFAGGMGFDVFYQGFLVTILTLAAFFIGEFLETGHWQFRNIAECNEGMTMAFLTMSMCEIFHSFNMRSQRGSVLGMAFAQKSHNWVLYGAMAASLVLTTAIIEIPFLADMFDFVHLDLKAYAISIGLAFLVIPIVEIIKAVQRGMSKNK